MQKFENGNGIWVNDLPAAGAKRLFQSLPQSARFWQRAGSQVRQVSGRRRTPELPSTALCSTRHRLLKEDAVMEESGWALAQRRHGERYHSRFCQNNFVAVRALDILVCGAINEPHLPADGSITNQFFCVRFDQRTLATRKHELWECSGNNLINHTHMQESDHLVNWAQEFWDADQVLFARGVMHT